MKKRIFKYIMALILLLIAIAIVALFCCGTLKASEEEMGELACEQQEEVLAIEEPVVVIIPPLNDDNPVCVDEEIVEESVEDAVDITANVKLKNENVFYDDVATLVAYVQGVASGEVEYQWQMNTGNGWKDIGGENNSTYSFVVDENNANYNYRVVVSK